MTAFAFPGPWIDGTVDATRAAIARWAISRVGVYEIPPGSNRSELIDLWNALAGAMVKSAWCAALACAAWRENNVSPLGDASCEHWHERAAATGRWVRTPKIGDIALFDFGTQAGWADHAGIVVRVSPTVLTVEGNTNESGGREGVGVFLKDRQGAGLLGYVSADLP